MSYHAILPALLAAIGIAAAVPAQTCTGPKIGLPGLGKVTIPPASSGVFSVSYPGTFKVTRTGVYTITGSVAIGRGAGAPVDFSHVKAVIVGAAVIDEKPPPIQGTPAPPNGWKYHWSIYYWQLSKQFETRVFLVENTVYKYHVEAKGAYTVYTPYHRRNYGVSLSASATYCGPRASVTSVGTGCVGSNSPTLSAPRPPVLGQRRDLVLAGRANASGFIAFGLPASSPLYIGAGCSIYVDLALPMLLFPTQTNAAGAGLLLFTVPNDPAAAGLRIATQGVLGNAVSPVGLDLTRGLILTLGY